MNKIPDLKYFEDKFDEYTGSFLSGLNDDNKKLNIELKIIHSKNVKESAKQIAISESLTAKEIFTATLCGLFHDIGRFEQYTKYNTFRDDASVYHGALGVEVIKSTGLLEGLPEKIIEIVLEVTYNHGLFSIPETSTGEKLFFSRLVRDADKTDIFRIVSEYYHKSGPRNIALEYGLDDKPQISGKVMESFRNGNLISKSELKTLNDFKTMQLSWIFDINFASTKRIIKNNKYLESVLSSMPDIPEKYELKTIIAKNI